MAKKKNLWKGTRQVYICFDAKYYPLSLQVCSLHFESREIFWWLLWCVFLKTSKYFKHFRAEKMQQPFKLSSWFHFWWPTI